MRRNAKRKSRWPLALMCIFTFLNFVLAILLRIYDRKQIVKAIQGDDGVQTLLISKKETKNL